MAKGGTAFQEFITIKDFARWLSIRPATAWLWCKQKRIRSVKVGRLVRIPFSEVQRLLGMPA